MTAGAVYARRDGRVLLAAPARPRVVFTAARARGELAPPLAVANTAEHRAVAGVRVWVALVPGLAPERPVRAA